MLRSYSSMRPAAARGTASLWTAVVVLVLLGVVVPGCRAPVVDRPMTTLLPDDPMEAQLEFWHGLQGRPVTCNDEAFHGLLLFADGKDEARDFGARVAMLKSRGWLAGNFDRPGNEAVRRGVVAVALVQALKIRGGWALSLLGPTPRYATRELMFVNIFPASSPEQTFSGAEFVGIIAKAEDHQSEARGEGMAATAEAQ